MNFFKTEICVVDDDPLYSEVLCKFLSKENFIIRKFNSGLEVLDKLDKKPDIIFMDLHMDAINGLQASKILKKRWPQVNIVLISSSENADIVLKENSADYDFFEPKSNELSGMLLQIENFQRKKMRRFIFSVVLAILALLSVIFLIVNTLF